LTDAVAELVTEKTVVLFEAPTCTELIPTSLRLNRPGSYFNSGGAGLGWCISACIGAKMAQPDSEVIALVGDGCYLFGVPSSTYWVANAYRTPFLTIIYNNGGWNAPKHSTLGVHPEGTAKQNDTFWVTIGAGARLSEIAAAAGNAAAFHVSARQELKDVLRRAMQTVREGRSAVVDVSIQGISRQVLE
jgi:acetolactate synthase-1/2/3 large subunit